MNQPANPSPAELRARVRIVLAEPRLPANIGAAARAMKNFGLADLWLIQPPQDRDGQGLALAHGAEDIYQNAHCVYTLEEALDDVQVVIGTTARLGGGWRADPFTPREAAPFILSRATNNRVAILFGSEDRGLSNREVDYCQALISIPTDSAHRSLNLAQAVLLIGYELFIAARPQADEDLELAPAKHIDAFLTDFADALTRINFLRPGNPDYWMMSFRRLFGRTGLTNPEVNLLRGVVRQIRWAAGQANLNPRE